MKPVRFVLLAMILLNVWTSLLAQVPHTISHQGYLADSTGVGVTATLPMTFRLFSDSTGGASAWSQNFPSVEVKHGVFNALLDVSSVTFTTPYWLELEIDGSIVAPRTRLSGVPYALGPWTESVDTLVTNPRLVSYSGRVGIGTSTPLLSLGIKRVGQQDGIQIDSPIPTIRIIESGTPKWELASNIFSTSHLTLYNYSRGEYDLYISNTNGRVGLGTTGPDQKLTVNGGASKPGGGSWSVFSDRRLKTDINSFKDGLSALRKINPVTFRYNGKTGLSTEKTYVGVIAQEIQKILPYTVETYKAKLNSNDTNETDLLRFDSNALLYVCINAIKDLDTRMAEMENLRSENRRLAARLADIEELNMRIAKLEKLLSEQENAEIRSTSDSR